MGEKKLKKKLLTHILKNGRKQISEKILTKSFKLIQKSQKKSHNEIVKLAILNLTPMFRVIKLKNKRRKKKSIKEIPAFLSNDIYRTSWGLKYLTKSSMQKTSGVFFKEFKHKILSNATSEGSAVAFKNELQKKALPRKKYFKHYRW